MIPLLPHTAPDSAQVVNAHIAWLSRKDNFLMQASHEAFQFVCGETSAEQQPWQATNQRFGNYLYWDYVVSQAFFFWKARGELHASLSFLPILLHKLLMQLQGSIWLPCQYLWKTLASVNLHIKASAFVGERNDSFLLALPWTPVCSHIHSTFQCHALVEMAYRV